jgi:hypothetical protein
MSTGSKIIVTVLLLLFLGGVGAADYWASRDTLIADVPTPSDQEPVMDDGETGSASSLTPGTGVAKRKAPQVADALKGLGFTTTTSSDQSMLEQVTMGNPASQSVAILKENDRIGSVVWIDTPEVKTIFNTLKESLLAAFTPAVKDLRDETKVQPGPVRNELTFLDTGLSTERLTFVRIGERLMEFHTVVGKEEVMKGAIEGLSKL